MTDSSASVPPPDFRALFEANPDAYLVLLPNPPVYTIVAATDAYLKATKTRRVEILGRGIFDVFPDNPANDGAVGAGSLRRSLDTVCRTREPDTMNVHRYDIRRREEEGGGFEVRCWAPRNSPVIGADGNVLYINHRVEVVALSDDRESRLAAIVESSESAIYGKTLDGIITSWNPAAERLYGYTPNEMIGRPISLLIPADRPDELPSILARVKSGERIAHYETERVCKDGRRVVISKTISPIKNAAGEIVGASSIASDISERRHIEIERDRLLESLRQERARIENIVTSVPGVVWEAWGQPDAAGQRINFVSAYVEKMLGYSVEEWQSTPNFWLTIVHPDDREAAAREAHRAFTTEDSHINAFRWITRDGRALNVESYSVVVKDDSGRPVGMRGVTLDVTERKQAEEERKRYLEEIESLNVRLHRAMRETHHRVKNNLQVISALINIQTMEHRDTVPVTELQRLSQHIHALASIHDLLTRQSRTAPDVEDLSVEAALEILAPTLQSMMKARHLHIMAEDTRLPIHHGTTLAVLINELVSNAIKHGEGDVSLTFVVTGNKARLEVTDRGKGFPPNFDPAAAANTGLELIASLAEWDLQGSIRYDNLPDGGARVVVEFPLPAKKDPN